MQPMRGFAQMNSIMMTESFIPLFVLSANAVYDILHREILLSSVLAMGVAGVLYRCCYLSDDITGMLTSLIPGLFLMAMSLISGNRIGKGDALLSLCLGEWLGLADCILVIFLASAGSSAAAAVLWMKKKKNSEIPFVPFLLSGYILQIILFNTGSI